MTTRKRTRRDADPTINQTQGTELFLSLSDMYGVGPEVRAIMREVGDLRPEGHFLTLPYLLATTRNRESLALSEIHKRSGISRSQLALYEGGQQKNPGLRTIHALAYGYNIPLGMVLLAVLNDMTPLPQVSKGLAQNDQNKHHRHQRHT